MPVDTFHRLLSLYFANVRNCVKPKKRRMVKKMLKTGQKEYCLRESVGKAGKALNQRIISNRDS